MCCKVILIVTVVMLFAGNVFAETNKKLYRGQTGKHFVITGENPSDHVFVETKKLDPASKYKNDTQIKAYQYANKYPHILDQLYCFCHCSVSFGHLNLLTCFTSDHAAGCGICMMQAIIAGEMADKGKSVKEIADEIDKMFGLLDEFDDSESEEDE